MMSKPTSALFGVLTLVAILAIAPSAFAQESTTVNISAGAGSGPTCSQSNNCFDPNTITVAPGTTVEWKNNDKVSHTVTSGSPSDNQTGTVFDSSLIASGKDFSFTFNTPGTFNYFCQVHPWMTGQVIVSASAASSGGPSSSAPTSENTTTTEPSQQPSSAPENVTTSAPVPENTTTYAPAPAPAPTPAPAPMPAPTPAPAPTSESSSANPDQASGWAAGMVVAAVMSGIGVWSAVRRR